MRKNIVLIVPSLRGGGAERVVLHLIKNLDRKIFNINLMLINKEGPYVHSIPRDINVIDLKCKRVRLAIPKLVKELNILNPDTILSTLGHLNLVVVAIKKFVKSNPKVIVRHANSPQMSLEKLPIMKKLFHKNLYIHLYKKADVVLAQCKEMREELIEYFKLSRNSVEYIYNPIDFEQINKLKKEFNPYRNEKINLLSVGRLTEQKGYNILLEAFAKVIKEEPNLFLTILGEGRLKKMLIEKVKSLKLEANVKFEDFKINPYPYFYYADLYILSSIHEGFPNTLLEAMACGTKVVATNCKSGPTEILDGNKFGTLVEVSNVDSLVDGIKLALCSENKTSNRADLYDVKSIILEYEKILY